VLVESRAAARAAESQVRDSQLSRASPAHCIVTTQTLTPPAGSTLIVSLATHSATGECSDASGVRALLEVGATVSPATVAHTGLGRYRLSAQLPARVGKALLHVLIGETAVAGTPVELDLTDTQPVDPVLPRTGGRRAWLDLSSLQHFPTFGTPLTYTLYTPVASDVRRGSGGGHTDGGDGGDRDRAGRAVVAKLEHCLEAPGGAYLSSWRPLKATRLRERERERERARERDECAASERESTRDSQRDLDGGSRPATAYRIVVRPPAPGAYRVHVHVGGEPVLGSPIAVEVFDTPGAAVAAAAASAEESAARRTFVRAALAAESAAAAKAAASTIARRLTGAERPVDPPPGVADGNGSEGQGDEYMDEAVPASSVPRHSVYDGEEGYSGLLAGRLARRKLDSSSGGGGGGGGVSSTDDGEVGEDGEAASVSARRAPAGGGVAAEDYGRLGYARRSVPAEDVSTDDLSNDSEDDFFLSASMAAEAEVAAALRQVGAGSTSPPVSLSPQVSSRVGQVRSSSASSIATSHSAHASAASPPASPSNSGGRHSARRRGTRRRRAKT